MPQPRNKGTAPRAQGRLQALVSGLLRPGQELLEVQYFTARVRDNPDAELRQALYREALASHSLRVRLIEGRFQDKPRECWNCGTRWMVYEEKETDVTIAIAMLTAQALTTAARDRHEGRCEAHPPCVLDLARSYRPRPTLP